MNHDTFLKSEHAHRIRQMVRGILSEHRNSLVGRIGNTPLLLLDRINPHPRVKVYLKHEGCNPSGSVKDRTALYLIADALSGGALDPQGAVLEASSGNTGISLSFVGARLGLRVVITVPDNVSVERHKIIKAYGANALLTPGSAGTSGAIDKARELVAGKQGRYLWTAQHYNEVNSFAHYETTGREIIDQIAALGEKRLDAFVATSGTTGTLMGTSARIKETLPDAKVVSVWPADKIMGIRKPEGENCPTIYRESLIDEVQEFTNAAALEMVGQLANLEGVFVGPSGGAAVLGALAVARRLAEKQGEGVVVALVPDNGERYLSTEGFSPSYGRRVTDAGLEAPRTARDVTGACGALPMEKK